jgi:hypothetical protein
VSAVPQLVRGQEITSNEVGGSIPPGVRHP